jgi:hypothetical protein
MNVSKLCHGNGQLNVWLYIQHIRCSPGFVFFSAAMGEQGYKLPGLRDYNRSADPGDLIEKGGGAGPERLYLSTCYVDQSLSSVSAAESNYLRNAESERS